MIGLAAASATAAAGTLADVQSWWDRWIWPAGGSGGTPGDVVGTLIWVVIAALVVRLLWNPVKHLIQSHIDVRLEYLHRKLDAHADLLEHIIKHHPDIPDHDIQVPRGILDHATIKARAKARRAAVRAAGSEKATTGSS